MPKRKEPMLDPKDQFKRFKETAKELGIDENGKNAERVFRSLAKKHPLNRPKSASEKR